jgi:hypothetical protein
LPWTTAPLLEPGFGWKASILYPSLEKGYRMHESSLLIYTKN